MTTATDLTLSPAQATHLLTAAGIDAACTAITPLTGGMINTVLRLDLDGPPGRLVVKLNRAGQADFETEARRLRYARDVGGLACPRVQATGGPDGVVSWVWLLMECLPGQCLQAAPIDAAGRARVERQLATALADLHEHRRDTFGPVDGPGVTDWRDVFLPRLAEMRAEMVGRLDDAVLADIDRALDAAPAAFADQVAPTLVHGDVWDGNILVDRDADGWRLTGLVDPGVEFADVEQELAYLQVFDRVGDAFFDAYTARHPLRPGFAERRPFYWLQTLMVHVWFFGQRYVERTAALAARLATFG